MIKERAIFAVEPEGDPFYNMVADNLLFRLCCDSELEYSAVLRLYSWAIPAITIGYNQDVSRILQSEKLEEGLPVIRRITGGRAIYHDPSELTFSLVADMSKLAGGKRSLSQINSQISETLVDILNQFGINARWQKHSDNNFRNGERQSPGACFDSVSRYEIVTDSGKIVGGAQRIKENCFIHQGSLKVNGIIGHPAIVGSTRPLKNDVFQKDRFIAIPDIKDAFRNTFSSHFDLCFADEPIPIVIQEKIMKEIDEFVKFPLKK